MTFGAAIFLIFIVLLGIVAGFFGILSIKEPRGGLPGLCLLMFAAFLIWFGLAKGFEYF